MKTVQPTHTPISRQKEAFADFLAAKGMRITHERMAIIQAIQQLDTPFGAEAVISHLATQGIGISRATVYNTLSLLRQSSLLTTSTTPGSRQFTSAKWPPRSATLQCSGCGKTKLVRSTQLSSALSALPVGRFRPSGTNIIISGLCIKCQRATSHKTRNQ